MPTVQPWSLELSFAEWSVLYLTDIPNCNPSKIGAWKCSNLQEYDSLIYNYSMNVLLYVLSFQKIVCMCIYICILYTCTSTSYTYLYIPHEGPFGPAEAGWCHSRNKHRGRLSQLQWKWCSHLGGRYPIDEAGRWTDDTRNFMKLLLLLKLHTSTEQSDLTGMSTSPTIETLIIKFKMLI